MSSYFRCIQDSQTYRIEFSTNSENQLGLIFYKEFLQALSQSSFEFNTNHDYATIEISSLTAKAMIEDFGKYAPELMK